MKKEKGSSLLKKLPTRRSLRKRSKIEKRLRVLFQITLFFIIPIVIVNLFVAAGQMRIMYVVSNSMVPTFERGDLILLSEDHYGSLEEGDIIAYNASWHPDGPITHRIVSKSETEYITKGDSNNVSDPAITDDQVIGEIIAWIPKLGYLFNPVSVISLVSISSILYSLMLFSRTNVFLKIFKRKNSKRY